VELDDWSGKETQGIRDGRDDRIGDGQTITYSRLAESATWIIRQKLETARKKIRKRNETETKTYKRGWKFWSTLHIVQPLKNELAVDRATFHETRLIDSKWPRWYIRRWWYYDGNKGWGEQDRRKPARISQTLQITASDQPQVDPKDNNTLTDMTLEGILPDVVLLAFQSGMTEKATTNPRNRMVPNTLKFLTNGGINGKGL